MSDWLAAHHHPGCNVGVGPYLAPMPTKPRNQAVAHVDEEHKQPPTHLFQPAREKTIIMSEKVWSSTSSPKSGVVLVCLISPHGQQIYLGKLSVALKK